MPRAMLVIAPLLALMLYSEAEDKPLPAFVLHITHVNNEDVGDKPVDHDCKNRPCTTLIVTVEGHSTQIDYRLECKQWVLLTEPMTTGKCWALETGKDYPARRSGRNLLFYDDTPKTNPLFTITDEAERKGK